MFMSQETAQQDSRRDRRRVWILSSSLALHALALATVAAFQVWRTALAQFDIGLASAQTIIFAILVSLVTLPLTWLHRYSEAHAG